MIEAAMNFLSVSFCLLLVQQGVSSLRMLNEAEKTESLNTHNSLRSAVYPRASNMQYMIWDIRLEELSQRAANSCKFEHNYDGDYAGLGENLYKGWRTNMTEIVTFYFMERLAWTLETGSCNQSDPRNVFNFNQCGHYWQAVGWDLVRVGCAIQECAGPSYLSVCEYNKAYPSPIYEKGPPCSNCPVEAPFCYRDLCVNRTQKASLGSQEITCALQCKHCSVKVENDQSCYCSQCHDNFEGSNCGKLKSGRSMPTLNCSKCVSDGTPCQNGANDTSTATTCSCSCKSGYSGPFCETPNALANDAVRVTLGGQLFSSNSKSSPIPVSLYDWKSTVYSSLADYMASTVNNECQNSGNQSFCCRGTTVSNSMGSLVNSKNVGVLTNPEIDAAGRLIVTLYMNSSSSDNTMCPRRKPDCPIYKRVLLNALQANMSAVNSSLLYCCGVYLLGVEQATTTNGVGLCISSASPALQPGDVARLALLLVFLIKYAIAISAP